MDKLLIPVVLFVLWTIPVKQERPNKLKAPAATVDAFIEKAKRFKTIVKMLA